MVLPLRPKPSCCDPPVKLPVPPATSGTSLSHDSPPAAPLQKTPAKPSVPSVQNMQNRQDTCTSPPVTTTRSGRVVIDPCQLCGPLVYETLLRINGQLVWDIIKRKWTWQSISLFSLLLIWIGLWLGDNYFIFFIFHSFFCKKGRCNNICFNYSLPA